MDSGRRHILLDHCRVSPAAMKAEMNPCVLALTLFLRHLPVQRHRLIRTKVLGPDAHTAACIQQVSRSQPDRCN